MVVFVQSDMKRLIAYSSVAHMGFVTLGCFLLFLMPRDPMIASSHLTNARLGLKVVCFK